MALATLAFIYLHHVSEVNIVYQWRTTDKGSIVVKKSDGLECIPTLDEKSARYFDGAVLRPWGTMAMQMSIRYDVPVSWILAVIFSESLGNPKAKNQEVPPGLGLMQITHPSHYTGHSQDELLENPALNIQIGTGILAVFKRHGHDLPAVASCYNGGECIPGMTPHPSSSNEWGYRCSKSYIDSVVRANNYYIKEDIEDCPPYIIPDEVIVQVMSERNRWDISSWLGLELSEYQLPGLNDNGSGNA